MRFCVSIAAITMISVSMAARADSFKITGPGIDDTFNLPATPTISASGSYGFSVDHVPVDENGIQATREIFFFNEDLGGGLLVSNGAAGADVNAFGTPLYTGVNDFPTFNVGSFTLSGFGTYTVTIEDIGTPEPGSLLLLAIGLLAVAGISKNHINARKSFLGWRYRSR